MTYFEGGSGGLDVLGRFVKNDKLVLTDRLDAIEVALRRGIITVEELRSPGVAPTPFEFGLKSDVQPTAVPLMLSAWYRRNEMQVAGFVFLASIVVGIIWLYIVSREIILAVLIGGFIGAMGGMGIAVAAMLLIIAVNHVVPGAGAWRRYKAAATRHEILVIAKTLQALEREVRAFQTANGPEFERLVARAFRRHGYCVEEIGGSNDGGVDLIVTRGSFRAIVQCKAHAKQVGPAVVRELYGALSHGTASTAFLATTAGVSASAREWAKGKPIIFLEPDHLIQGRGM